MIVLIGTSHIYQARCKELAAHHYVQFEEMLLGVCAKHDVAAIAEEFNEDALAERGVSSSVISDLCVREDLIHQFSDPGNVTRALLGVEDCLALKAVGWANGEPNELTESRVRESHAKRECYWLEQIEKLNAWPLLFVCGADHIKPFSALLHKAAHEVTVEFFDWKPKES